MRTRVTGEEPAEEARFCLVFPRETISVPVMRRMLNNILGRLGVDEEYVSDLLLAVTEACTNVLRHSGPGRGYEVVVLVGRTRCVIEVVDNGQGFDPAALPGHRAPLRSVPRFRRHRATTSAPWPSPVPAAPSAMRNRLSRVRRGGADRALEQIPQSGRGIAIMRACVDDVTLSTRPGRGTVVSLEKRIKLRGDAPLAHPEAVPLRDAG
jgi:anti-sigma regulatory factor (Ser/Thr protein kinase)